jgi:alpha-glucosidase
VLDLWLERGADGFRLDVANAYLHDPKLTDNPAVPAAQRNFLGWAAAANMQRHLYDANLVENRAVLDVVRQRVEKFAGRFVFGEFSEEFERSGCYLPPDAGLHAGYNFALLMAADAQGVVAHLKTLADWPDHWPCVAFSNHDVIRTVTRFGEGSAKVTLALLCALRGTVLLFQGEELGLPEVDLRRDQMRDPVGDLYYPLFKGRDGCRTPMPWDAGAPSLGFSSDTPWLPLGPDHATLAVSQQDGDPASALAYTRALMAVRKAHPALHHGSLTLLDGPLAFLREAEGEQIVCVFNPGEGEITQTLPAPLRVLPCGTGPAKVSGTTLTLGPRSAFFGESLERGLDR